MKLYFYVHDASWFHGTLIPALTDAWQHRSFHSCKGVCQRIIANCSESPDEFIVHPGSTLSAHIVAGQPFDYAGWKILVGEALALGAAEIPIVPEILPALKHLMRTSLHENRECFSPVQQIELGTREIRLGGVAYRPDFSGVNQETDIERLESFLVSFDAEAWKPDDLFGMPGLEDEDQRHDELEYLRQEHPHLTAILTRAKSNHQIIVCEYL